MASRQPRCSGSHPFSTIDTARRRYAIVGTGDRAIGMWGRPLVKEYGDVLEFVGLCDVNAKRVAVAKQMIGVDCPTFTSFDEMCDRSKPDLLMVTTVDAFHHEYITRGLDRGLDVMTEKPMVIDERQCQAVIDAERRNNKRIVVTFNYRYAPGHRTVKETLMSGEIGRVLSADFSWYLDVYHGADYFRRWHRLRNRGGSLLVHKATHHFDLMNWWLDADPVEVVADGGAEGLRKERIVSSRELSRVPAHEDVPLPLRHDERCRAHAAIRRLRGRRSLLPRWVRVPRGRRHLRHDVGDGEVLERRHDELFPERAHAV